jgi:uncharacterized protein (TIGR02118 family)
MLTIDWFRGTGFLCNSVRGPKIIVTETGDILGDVRVKGPAMINAVNLLKRRQDLSGEEFQQYWRSRHADVIAKLPGVQRYVQSHPLLEIYEEGDPPYDGIAELWADDSQAFRVIGASDAYVAVQADEENFLDRGAIVLVLTDEYVIKDGSVGKDGVKCIRLFKRREDMAVEEFQSHWRQQYAPTIATLPSLDRYVQYQARAGGYAKGREPAYDGIDITWFGSVNDLQGALDSAEFERARSDERNFLAAAPCPQIIARERVIIG